MKAFFKFFALGQITSALASAKTTLVSANPEAAIAAEDAANREDLRELRVELEQARREHAAELDDVRRLETRRADYLGRIQKLTGEIAVATPGPQLTLLEDHRRLFMNEIDLIDANLPREKAEAELAKRLLDKVEAAVALAATEPQKAPVDDAERLRRLGIAA